MKFRIVGFLLVYLLFISIPKTFSEEIDPHASKHGESVDHQSEETHGEKKKIFNPGDFIFDHIGDAHIWHLWTWRGNPVSIYLPVIVYSKENGLVSFSSRKFHHGHESVNVNGYLYTLHMEGEKKGKITEETPGGDELMPLDFSIKKNVASLFFSILLLFGLFLPAARKYAANPVSAPRGLQSWIEPMIIFVRDDIAKPSIGKHYKRYLPFLLTVFFFIWINNMLGLIPIFGTNLTGNISITVVLAVITFIITTFSGNKNYWQHIFNMPGVPWWLKFPIPLMPVIELIGMFTKPIVLMVRLFANITAGHIVTLAFFSLIFIFGNMNIFVGYGVSVFSIVFVIFISFVELLVAFIQAFVFTLLSAIYFGLALEEHH